MVTAILTRKGYNQLQHELDYLRTTRRSEVAERLREAMADGDAGIDSDAECEAAKNEQAFVEGRIRDLEGTLANANVIDKIGNSEIVQIGATVTIKEDGASNETYTIVGAAETDPLQNLISYESPLGAALIDHRAGDKVTVKAPSGEFYVNIIDIE